LQGRLAGYRNGAALGAEANPVEDGGVPPIYNTIGRLGRKLLIPGIQALSDAGAKPDARWTKVREPASARLDEKMRCWLSSEIERRRLERSTPGVAGERSSIALRTGFDAIRRRV
jgi:hypothetical protein